MKTKKWFLLTAILACVMTAAPVFAETIPVVSKIQHETPYSHWTYKFTYNSGTGLLKKYVMEDTPEYRATYHYDNEGNLKLINEYGESGLTGKYSYKYSDGKLSSIVNKSIDNGKVFSTAKLSYKWNGNTCKVMADDRSPETFLFEGGKMMRDIIAITGGRVTYRYWYNNNGHIRAQKVYATTNGEMSTYVSKYQNRYKSGLLSEINYTDEEGFNFITISYKNLEVPASFAAKVKKQQEYMVLHAAIGDGVYFTEPTM